MLSRWVVGGRMSKTNGEGMMEKKRPLGVKVSGWFIISLSVPVMVFAILLLDYFVFNIKNYGWIVYEYLIFSVFSVLLSIGLLVCGIFILKLKNWARLLFCWSSHNDDVIGKIAIKPFGQNGYWGFIRFDFPFDHLIFSFLTILLPSLFNPL